MLFYQQPIDGVLAARRHFRENDAPLLILRAMWWRRAVAVPFGYAELCFQAAFNLRHRVYKDEIV